MDRGMLGKHCAWETGWGSIPQISANQLTDRYKQEYRRFSGKELTVQISLCQPNVTIMNIFFISDTHYGHQNACKVFKRHNGTPLRDFSCAEECDQYQEEQWNKTVRATDKVYHLGDITMSGKYLPILDRLNGEKVLIRGNHDTEKATRYLKYFKDIRGSHQFDGLLLTHIPVHTESLARWGFNVHGHTHANNVEIDIGVTPGMFIQPDPRYLCVSVEQEHMNYTPISLEQVKKIKLERGI